MKDIGQWIVTNLECPFIASKLGLRLEAGRIGVGRIKNGRIENGQGVPKPDACGGIKSSNFIKIALACGMQRYSPELPIPHIP